MSPGSSGVWCLPFSSTVSFCYPIPPFIHCSPARFHLLVLEATRSSFRTLVCGCWIRCRRLVSLCSTSASLWTPATSTSFDFTCETQVENCWANPYQWGPERWSDSESIMLNGRPYPKSRIYIPDIVLVYSSSFFYMYHVWASWFEMTLKLFPS